MADEILGKPVTEVVASSSELEAQIAALQEKLGAVKAAEKAVVAAKGADFLKALLAAAAEVVKATGFAPMAVLLVPKEGAYSADFYSPPKRAKGKPTAGDAAVARVSKPNGGKVTLNKVIEHLGGLERLELVGNAGKFTTAREACKALGLKTWEEDKAGDGAGTTIIAYTKDNPGKVIVHFVGGASMTLEAAAAKVKAERK